MGGSDDVIGGWILGIQNADRREAKMSALESALHDTEQALAEKDREIQQIREHEFQRGYQEAEEKYQQLMEKAVRFAERLDTMDKGSEVHWNDVEEFLNSPEVQAWKEREI